jgi:hypothetical protein
LNSPITSRIYGEILAVAYLREPFDEQPEMIQLACREALTIIEEMD